MTDKERILSLIIQKVYSKYILGIPYNGDAKFSYLSNVGNVKVGDLVICQTCSPNPFLLGFVIKIYSDECMVLREIGGTKTCKISNEDFCKIDIKSLGYEILEGLEYETYHKVGKAFKKYADYPTRFHSISFLDGVCTVNAREAYSNEIIKTVTFKPFRKTTIKEIGKLLNE